MGNGTAPPWTPATGELVAERFDLEREIARGGMGSIWRAHHVRLDTPVAVKFIDAKFADSEFLRERFQREARAAARLRSRHVVQILDYGVWQKIPYIAMELLEGETLADRLERQGRLEPTETLSLVKGVVRALSKAAELSIVHRDLKPENLFIVSERGHDYAKVLDFGVAKLRDPNLLDSNGHTKTGVVVGTPYYMSPEQSDGTRTVDPRSDLWSLAVIVFECLTGELPFYSEAFGNLVLKINSGPIPVPSDRRRDLPRAFDGWWSRAASRDPDERFQTADDFFAALYDALIDPRQSLSSYPFLLDPSPGHEPGASFTPRSVRFDSALPPSRPAANDRRSEPPADDPLTWSGPHSSARPEGSLPPPDLGPESTPAPRRSHRGTFSGHAASHPPMEARSQRRRFAALALGSVVVAAGIGWMMAGGPVLSQPAQAGALRPPEDLQPTAAVVEAEPPTDDVPSGVAEPDQEEDDEVKATEKPAPTPRAPTPTRPRPAPAAPADGVGSDRFPAGI